MQAILLASLLSFQDPAPALQEQREVCVARVLNPAGRPQAGARLQFVYKGLRSAPGPADDFVEAKSDARGMCRAALLPGRRYSTWARWADGASYIEEGVEAGSFLQLSTDPAARPREVVCAGLQDWEKLGALRFRVNLLSESLHFVPLRRRGDRLQIPALPQSATLRRQVEILDAAGEVLWALDLPAPHERATLDLPTLRERVFRVTDPQGRGIPGAAIRRQLPNTWYSDSPVLGSMERFRVRWPVIGRTDAEGWLRCKIPIDPKGHPPTLFCAQKPGYSRALGGRGQLGPIINGHTLERGEKPPGHQPFTLRERAPSRIAGSPAYRRSPLLVRWRVHYHVRGNRFMGMPMDEILRPDAQGQYPSLPNPESTLVDFAAWPRLPRAGQPGGPAMIHTHMPYTEVMGKRPIPWADLVPRPRNHVLTLQVVDHDGRPADRALCWLADIRDGKPVARTRAVFRSNQRGRVQVTADRLPAFLLVVTRQGHYQTLLKEQPAAHPLRIQLRRRPRVQLRLVDPSGQVHAHRRLDGQARPTLSDAGKLLAPHHYAATVYGYMDRIVTDAEGRADLFLLPSRSDRGLGLLHGSAATPPIWIPGQGPWPQQVLEVEVPGR